MEGTPVQVIDGNLTDDAPLDTAISRAILRKVSDGDLPETFQIGRPHKVVAFGRHDAITPGFRRAVSIVVRRGFDPTIRTAGGRAVVFHDDAIRFAWTVPTPDPVRTMQSRFELIADRVVDTLSSFDIEAVVGELPREYCPGKYSVSVPGTGKVMGSGQRLAPRAAQIAGVIVVKNAEAVNAVLEPVYDALGLDMDPAVTGSLSDVTNIDTSAVVDRFSQRIVRDRDSIDAGIGNETMALAREFRADHDPRILA